MATRWIVPSERDVVAQIKPYADVGFTHLVFHRPGFHQERFPTFFTAVVVPTLRAL